MNTGQLQFTLYSYRWTFIPLVRSSFLLEIYTMTFRERIGPFREGHGEPFCLSMPAICFTKFP